MLIGTKVLLASDDAGRESKKTGRKNESIKENLVLENLNEEELAEIAK